MHSSILDSHQKSKMKNLMNEILFATMRIKDNVPITCKHLHVTPLNHTHNNTPLTFDDFEEHLNTIQWQFTRQQNLITTPFNKMTN